MLGERDEEKLRSREPGAAVFSALRQLIAKDTYLLLIDANERSISYRLAMYLQLELPDWHVDAEYNRDGINPKTIEWLGLEPNAEDTESRTVFPDIIVHIRGKRENYLVIELKKSTSTICKEVDFKKLLGYKKDLDYQYALFIELAAGGKSGVATLVHRRIQRIHKGR
jgi:hypothetical protein